MKLLKVPMIGIDTNILVRYVTGDDETQSEKVDKLIDQYVGKSASIFINNIVICELIWVLEKGYKYHKNQIVTVLKEVAVTLEFCFEDHQTFWLSIIEYEKSTVDFSDILIGNINIVKGCTENFTFDLKASSLLLFKLL